MELEIDKIMVGTRKRSTDELKVFELDSCGPEGGEKMKVVFVDESISNENLWFNVPDHVYQIFASVFLPYWSVGIQSDALSKVVGDADLIFCSVSCGFHWQGSLIPLYAALGEATECPKIVYMDGGDHEILMNAGWPGWLVGYQEFMEKNNMFYLCTTEASKALMEPLLKRVVYLPFAINYEAAKRFMNFEKKDYILVPHPESWQPCNTLEQLYAEYCNLPFKVGGGLPYHQWMKLLGEAKACINIRLRWLAQGSIAIDAAVTGTPHIGLCGDCGAIEFWPQLTLPIWESQKIKELVLTCYADGGQEYIDYARQKLQEHDVLKLKERYHTLLIQQGILDASYIPSEKGISNSTLLSNCGKGILDASDIPL